MKKLIAYISIAIYSLFWCSIFTFLGILVYCHFYATQTSIHASMITMQTSYNMANIAIATQFTFHLLILCALGVCILLLIHISNNKLKQLITHIMCRNKTKERKN